VYTLGQAARASGRSKTTLGRYVKSGRISATRAEDGRLMIDPAELHRVFPVARNGHTEMERSGTPDGLDPGPGPAHATLHQLLAERDRLVAEQGETIRDLRERLDCADERVAAEVEERRRLLALLTDQRTRPWWRRWLR